MKNTKGIEPHEFKKGESGNPKGRPRKLISETIKELEAEGVQQTTTTEIKAVYLMLINLTIPELQTRISDLKQSALVRIVGKAILSGKGFEIIERMLDRTLGKPQQSVDVTTDGEKINTTPVFGTNPLDGK